MPSLTERVTFSLPADDKARLVARARQRGISTGELMREITANLVTEHYLTVALANKVVRKDSTFR